MHNINLTDHNGPVNMSFLDYKSEVFYDCNKIVIWQVLCLTRFRFGQDMFVQDHKR
jgi:hypothetical protein